MFEIHEDPKGLAVGRCYDNNIVCRVVLLAIRKTIVIIAPTEDITGETCDPAVINGDRVWALGDYSYILISFDCS